MRNINHDTGTTGHVRDGVITLVVLLLVFAAFDDITTDNATTFGPEYSALVGCAAWLTYVAARLLREGRRMLGGLSALALTAGLWTQHLIRPGVVPGLWPESIVITAAYVWFWGLSLALLWMGCRSASRNRKVSAQTILHADERRGL